MCRILFALQNYQRSVHCVLIIIIMYINLMVKTESYPFLKMKYVAQIILNRDQMEWTAFLEDIFSQDFSLHVTPKSQFQFHDLILMLKSETEATIIDVGLKKAVHTVKDLLRENGTFLTIKECRIIYKTQSISISQHWEVLQQLFKTIQKTVQIVALLSYIVHAAQYQHNLTEKHSYPMQPFDISLIKQCTHGYCFYMKILTANICFTCCNRH